MFKLCSKMKKKNCSLFFYLWLIFVAFFNIYLNKKKNKKLVYINPLSTFVSSLAYIKWNKKLEKLNQNKEIKIYEL